MADETVTTPQGDDSPRKNTSKADNSQPSGSRSTVSQENTKTTKSYYHACQDKPTPKWWHRIDWSQVVLDCLLLIVGVKLACIYSGQLRQMIKSNEIQRTSAAVAQRAYLLYLPTISPTSFGVFPNGEKGWAFGPEFENGGNTPAFKVLHKTSTNAPDFGNLPKDFDYRDNEMTKANKEAFTNLDETEAGPVIIGPHSKGSGGIIAIRRQNLEGVNSGKHHVYMWGWVRYEDVFGCQHKTEFCLQVVGFMANKSGATNAMISQCGKQHNCADQECLDYERTKTPLCALESKPLE